MNLSAMGKGEVRSDLHECCFNWRNPVLGVDLYIGRANPLDHACVIIRIYHYLGFIIAKVGKIKR